MQTTDPQSDATQEATLAPELDPPAGERNGWLDSVLPKAEFTVLLFYRGLW